MGMGPAKIRVKTPTGDINAAVVVGKGLNWETIFTAVSTWMSVLEVSLIITNNMNRLIENSDIKSVFG